MKSYIVYCPSATQLELLTAFLRFTSARVTEDFQLFTWLSQNWVLLRARTAMNWSIVKDQLTAFETPCTFIPTGATSVDVMTALERYGVALVQFCTILNELAGEESSIEEEEPSGESLESEDVSEDDDSGSDLKDFIVDDDDE